MGAEKEGATPAKIGNSLNLITLDNLGPVAVASRQGWRQCTIAHNIIQGIHHTIVRNTHTSDSFTRWVEMKAKVHNRHDE